jgi:hypothetical protein
MLSRGYLLSVFKILLAVFAVQYLLMRVWNRRKGILHALLVVAWAATSWVFLTQLNDVGTEGFIAAQTIKRDREEVVLLRRGVARQYDWLPDVIEHPILHALRLRQNFQNIKAAGTDVDRDVVLDSTLEFLTYLPRAAQNAFLGPYPSYWHAPGAALSSKLMRFFNGLEMAIFYLLMMFASLMIVRHAKKGRDAAARDGICTSTLLGILAFAIMVGTLNAAITTNFGTLVRLRYPYFSVVFALLSAAALTWVEARQRMKRGVPDAISASLGLKIEIAQKDQLQDRFS